MVGLLLDIFGLIFTRQIYSCSDDSGSQFTGPAVNCKLTYPLRLYNFWLLWGSYCMYVVGDDKYYQKAKDCYDRNAQQTSNRACYCVTNKLCTVLYIGSSGRSNSCYEKVTLYDSSLSTVVALACVLTLTMLMYTSLLLTCFVWKLIDSCDRTGMRRGIPQSSKEEAKAQLQQQ